MNQRHTLPIFQVDAFITDKSFSGNPAAVCLLTVSKSAEWMQAVAEEMNLSETAFVCACDDGFELRWFTPTIEVDLCGHATLAAAHVLWEQNMLTAGTTARFQSKSGCLRVRQSADRIELDFPAEPVVATKAPDALLSALGIEHAEVYRNRLDYLVTVPTVAEVRELTPDFSRLKKVDIRGVMVTAGADDANVDFVSRFFAPAAGINEDPVTGSAHCALYPFWSERLNKTEMTAFQASKRGGLLKLRGEEGRVMIAGRTLTVTSGELYV
ncbi:MAG: PhzF family phenazine biosynthesis protein [Gammaproteobacteria bacterium]|nr:PhzF family phenazine biosynthesis protein [Gammaproteobacteria bacterium]MCF6261622.1 PhzF family phenazine biosynthesis protein [Gammaproteobacteria bacterium]